jgi:hypothetical protein
LLKEIAKPEAECRDDRISGAARVAVEEDAAIVALSDAQARVVVLVRRASSRPALAVTDDVIEQLKNPLNDVTHWRCSALTSVRRSGADVGDRRHVGEPTRSRTFRFGDGRPRSGRVKSQDVV